MSKLNSPVMAIIPARFQSSRFPGKPLAVIGGKTLIQHTYENTCRADIFGEVVVATDDSRIYDHVQSFGGKVVMTPDTCLTGSDRAAEVLKQEASYAHYQIVINVQGDEPCVHRALLIALYQSLESDPQAVMSTAATPIRSNSDAENRNMSKCVMDLQGNALYFSRSLIPAGHQGGFRPTAPIYRHIGIYAFRRDFLLTYANLPPTPLQQAEDLEGLRALEHGYRIKVTCVEESPIGVDTPQDIRKVEELLCKQNSSLLPAASVPR